MNTDVCLSWHLARHKRFSVLAVSELLCILYLCTPLSLYSVGLPCFSAFELDIEAFLMSHILCQVLVAKCCLLS
jgi:hypothetical protein